MPSRYHPDFNKLIDTVLGACYTLGMAITGATLWPHPSHPRWTANTSPGRAPVIANHSLLPGALYFEGLYAANPNSQA